MLAHEMHDGWALAIELPVRRELISELRNHVSLNVPDDIERVPSSPKRQIQRILVPVGQIALMLCHQCDGCREEPFVPDFGKIDKQNPRVKVAELVRKAPLPRKGA